MHRDREPHICAMRLVAVGSGDGAELKQVRCHFLNQCRPFLHGKPDIYISLLEPNSIRCNVQYIICGFTINSIPASMPWCALQLFSSYAALVLHV